MEAIATREKKNQERQIHVAAFRGRGWWSPEILSIENNYIIYKKRSSLFAPMFTITVPRLNIRSVELLETLTGTLLKITTLSNNNILSHSFTKSDIAKIQKILMR